MSRFVLALSLVLALCGVRPPSVIAAPAPTITTLQVAGDVVTIGWQDTGGPYVLEAGTSNGEANLLIAPLTVNPTVFHGVPSGTYYVRVRDRLGMASDDGLVRVTPCPSTLPAPSWLRSSTDGQRVTLSWDRSNGCGVTYRVLAGSQSGQADVATIDVGSVDTLTVMAPRGLYYVTVVAVQPSGASSPSNEIAVASGLDDAADTTPTVHVDASTLSYVTTGSYWEIPGRLRILGEVHNGTNQTVALPFVVATVRTPNGTVMGEAGVNPPISYAWAPAPRRVSEGVFGIAEWALLPGERGCFSLVTPFQVAEVGSVDLSVGSFFLNRRNGFRLTPTRSRVVLGSTPTEVSYQGQLHYEGSLTNLGPTTAYGTTVGVTLKNAEGRVVDCTWRQPRGTCAQTIDVFDPRYAPNPDGATIPAGASSTFCVPTRLPIGSQVSAQGFILWREP